MKPSRQSREKAVVRAALRGFAAWRKEHGVTLEEALEWNGSTQPRQALIRATTALAAARRKR